MAVAQAARISHVTHRWGDMRLVERWTFLHLEDSTTDQTGGWLTRSHSDSEIDYYSVNSKKHRDSALSDTCSGSTANDDESLCSGATDVGDDDSSRLCVDTCSIVVPNENYSVGRQRSAPPVDAHQSLSGQPSVIRAPCAPAVPVSITLALGVWSLPCAAAPIWNCAVAPERSPATASKKTCRKKAPQPLPQPQRPGLVTPAAERTLSLDEKIPYSGCQGSMAVVAAKDHEQDPTTIIFRNLPSDIKRNLFLQVLDEEGFSKLYDFAHVPVDLQSRTGLGYALVNMVSHAAALMVIEHFDGFKGWSALDKPDHGVVMWNRPLQGLTAHIDRYRNSPLLHTSVLDQNKPAIFAGGVRIGFPAPTAQIRPPRLRHGKPKVVNTVTNVNPRHA